VHAAVSLCRAATRWDSDLRALPSTASAWDEGQTSGTPWEQTAAIDARDSASAAAELAAATAFQLHMRDAVVLARQCVTLGVRPGDLHFLMPALRLDHSEPAHAASRQQRRSAESSMPPCDAAAGDRRRPLTAGAAQPWPGPPLPDGMAQPDAMLGAAVRAQPGGSSQLVDSRAKTSLAQRPRNAMRQPGTRPPAGSNIGCRRSGASEDCHAAQGACDADGPTPDAAPAEQFSKQSGSAASSVCRSDDESAGGSWAANVHVTVKIPPCYGSPYPCAARVVRSTDAVDPSEHRRSSNNPAESAHRQTSVGTQASGARPAGGGGPVAPLRRWLTQGAAVADPSDGVAALSATQGRLILDGLNAVLRRLTDSAGLACAADALTAAAVPARPRSDVQQLRHRMADPTTADDIRNARPAASPARRPRDRQLPRRPGSATPSIERHRTAAILRPTSKHAARERPHVLSPVVTRRRSGQDATSTHHDLRASTRCVA